MVGLNKFVLGVTVALCLFALVPTAAGAASFYVSPAGADSRPCNLPAAPCRSIGTALERARGQAGSHIVHVAARHAGQRAVYREFVQIRRGAAHQPRVVLDGSWQAAGGGRAVIAPRGTGPTQGVLLDLPGAQLRNIDIDASGASSAAAALVLDVPGSDHRVNSVRVKTAPNQVGVVVNSPSARLGRLEVQATNSPALDYGARGEPVLVQDSALRQLAAGPAIRGSGLSSLIFRRSMAFAPATAPRVIATEGGRLFLDSSLVSGGHGGAIHLGGATGPSLRAVSSTIDAGVSGVADAGLAAVTLATGGNAEVDIIGSILLEPPLITVAGGAVIRCSYSDVPSTVVHNVSPPQTVACGAGNDGNAHHPPDQLFAGTAPFTGVESYRLRPGSPAINTGPRPAPSDATPFDLFGEARIQPPGTCAEAEDFIDKGALEFGCTPVKGAPRPPGLPNRHGKGGAVGTPGGSPAGRPGQPGHFGSARPVIRGQRAMSRRVAHRHRARIVFRLNTPARVVAVVRGTKLRRVIRRARAGRNAFVIPTHRLVPRKRAYLLRLVARSAGGLSQPRWVRFRVVARPGR